MNDLPPQLDHTTEPESAGAGNAPALPDHDGMRRGLEEAMAAAGETPERGAVRDARMAELCAQFPGQFAAIREEWDGARIIEPFLLAVAPNCVAAAEALQSLALELAQDAVIEYLMPPNRAMAVSIWATS